MDEKLYNVITSAADKHYNIVLKQQKTKTVQNQIKVRKKNSKKNVVFMERFKALTIRTETM